MDKFEVGKTYRRKENYYKKSMFECLFSGATTIVLRHTTDKTESTCFIGDRALFDEYTPPRSITRYACVYTDGVTIGMVDGLYMSEQAARDEEKNKASSTWRVIDVIPVTWTEPEA